MSGPQRDGAVPLGGDYGGVLPPVPLNRPASAIGWAYVEPGRAGAQGFTPPFQPAGAPSHLRRPASAVPEDAEVLEVMARTQATYKEPQQQQQQRQRGLPPLVPEEQGPGGGGHVVSSRLGVSGGSSGNLSSRSAQYGMLVPPGASGASMAASDAGAQQGGPRPASASSLVYEARAKEAESLYGDRACDMPAQRAFRGCFAPMAAACAPPRGEDGDDYVEDSSHGGGGSSLLAEASHSIASFFGVGGGEGNAQQTAAALNAAARRAAFLANVERKKAAEQTSAQQHQQQQQRGRRAYVDPVAAAASYLGDTNAASRYVYQPQPVQLQEEAAPVDGGEDTYSPEELEWQQQQQQQWQQGQAAGGGDDGAAWRARLGGEEAGQQPYGGVYAAPRGPR